MSLPVTNLDDRKFQDLVDEAKRMIPQLCPEWTNHNVSDPGVALIELFAWMTEMSVFRLNQVPDVFYTHMLNLLGFERFPASAARADVTFWLGAGVNDVVTIPAGSQVTTAGVVGDTRVFSTLETRSIAPPTLIAALTSEGPDTYVDQWEDLSLGLSSVKCFPRSPITPGDCFYLGFGDSLAGNVVRLDVQASIEGIGVIPTNPPLVWEAWTGGDWREATIPKLLRPGEVADTTGGLNRDGSVMFMVPRKHEPQTLGGIRAHWVRARLTPPVPGQPFYRASPQLRRVHAASVGGTVRAEHSDLVNGESLGTSTGKPDQVFTLSRRPVLPRNDDEVVELVTPTGAAGWEEVDDFVDSDDSSSHYNIDATTGEVRFGPLIRYPDGSTRQHGAVPPEGAQIRITSYRTGGGAAGNVGAGTVTALRNTIPFVTGVVNLEPASGGVDAETVQNAKARGPQSVRAGGRAVTLSDFERLTAASDPRVARVRCLPPEKPGKPLRLLVVPSIEERGDQQFFDDFALPDDMAEGINEYLDDRRVLGSTIEVGTPYYQGVTVAALLSARPNSPHPLVRERAMDALYQYINPLTGGPDRSGWPFDADLNSAQVYQLLESVEGVDRVEEVLFFEYDLRNQTRIGFGKELIKLEPQSLFLSANHQVVIR